MSVDLNCIILALKCSSLGLSSCVPSWILLQGWEGGLVPWSRCPAIRCWPGQPRPQSPLRLFGASQGLRGHSGLLGVRTVRSRSPSEARRTSASEPSGSVRAPRAVTSVPVAHGNSLLMKFNTGNQVTLKCIGASHVSHFVGS